MQSATTPQRPAVPLTEAIGAWRADMTRRNKRPASIKRFTTVVEDCIAWNEWRTARDVNFAGASKWLAHKVEKGWSAGTHDQAATALRAFARLMLGMEYIEKNPFLMLTNSGEAGEPGSRAMSTAEVRALILEAHNRAKYDQRAHRSNRAGFYAFLALTGLRHAEAIACKWKDIDFTDRCIVTDPKWSKNKRRQFIPISTELLMILTEQASAVDTDPGAAVFPTAPYRPTFRHDREEAGIAAKDRRGRPATMHSLRKWLRTELDGIVTAPSVAHRIIRHAVGSLDQIYCDRPQDEDYQAVERLPRIWPGWEWRESDNPENPTVDSQMKRDLTNGGDQSDTVLVQSATLHRVNGIQAPRQTVPQRTAHLLGVGCQRPDGRSLADKDESATGHYRTDHGPVVHVHIHQESSHAKESIGPDHAAPVSASRGTVHTDGMEHTYGDWPVPVGRPTDIGGGGGVGEHRDAAGSGAGRYPHGDPSAVARGDGRGNAGGDGHAREHPAPAPGGTGAGREGPRLGPEAGDFERADGDCVGSGVARSVPVGGDDLRHPPSPRTAADGFNGPSADPSLGLPLPGDGEPRPVPEPRYAVPVLRAGSALVPPLPSAACRGGGADSDGAAAWKDTLGPSHERPERGAPAYMGAKGRERPRQVESVADTTVTQPVSNPASTTLELHRAALDLAAAERAHAEAALERERNERQSAENRARILNWLEAHAKRWGPVIVIAIGTAAAAACAVGTRHREPVPTIAGPSGVKP